MAKIKLTWTHIKCAVPPKRILINNQPNYYFSFETFVIFVRSVISVLLTCV